MKDRDDCGADIIPMPERFNDRDGEDGLVPIVGQMVFLPLTMMVYGLGLLARAARAMPTSIGDPSQRLEPALRPRVVQLTQEHQAPPPTSSQGREVIPPAWDRPQLKIVRTEDAREDVEYPMPEPVQMQQPRNVGSHAPKGREEQSRMVDNKSLQDDLLKTVRYWVSFEKRGHETILYQHMDQVYDNLTDAQFTAWKMAEFMKKLEDGQIDLPYLRSGDRRYLFAENKDHKGKLGDVDPDDRRYLALDWEVVGRVQRRRGWFDERKTEALEEIADSVSKGAHRTLDVVITKD